MGSIPTPGNGGMNTNQAKKLKTLEKENTRLKNLVAELSLDNAILKEVGARMPYQKSNQPGQATSSG